MATRNKVVVYNPTRKRHEPIAAGDTLDPSILPPSSGGSSRKIWIGKANYKVVLVNKSEWDGPSPDLIVGERYLVQKVSPDEDFSNVGQGADDSVIFTATGTTPAVWTYSNVYRVVEDATLTEYYNTLGFAVSVELKTLDKGPVTVFTTSAPYWLNPLAIYNNGTVSPIDATKARV